VEEKRLRHYFVVRMMKGSPKNLVTFVGHNSAIKTHKFRCTYVTLLKQSIPSYNPRRWGTFPTFKPDLLMEFLNSYLWVIIR
jgi:hypothetical protein